MIVQLGLEAHSVADTLVVEAPCPANPFCGCLKYLEGVLWKGEKMVHTHFLKDNAEWRFHLLFFLLGLNEDPTDCCEQQFL